MNSFQEKFKVFVKEKNLFNYQNTILIAVSGGIDSVTMAHLFQAAKFKFGIAHCNFSLRCEESDNDEHFVKNLANELNVPFYSTKFATNDYAKSQGVSTQMAARELRYKWFEKIRFENNYDYIAIAHHTDDEVETFLINLIRGTGIAGLHGILSKKNHIVRPLLFANREQIVNYCHEMKFTYREDSSNASEKYIRNKIRLKTLPDLKKLNPQIIETIKSEIEKLKEVEIIYRNSIESAKKVLLVDDGKEIRINIKKLKKLSPIKTYLFELLQPFNFNAAVVQNIIESLNGEAGKQFFSNTHQLIKDRSDLIIIPQKIKENNFTLIQENSTSIALPLNIRIELKENKNFKIPTSPLVGCFDFDKLKFPLTIRKWENGDSFHPLGMRQKKKLSDFFIDNKIPIHQKETTYILESDRKIVWVIGMRIDNRFKITDKTKKIYYLLSDKN